MQVYARSIGFAVNCPIWTGYVNETGIFDIRTKGYFMNENLKLNLARQNKKDEFYTQYTDITNEIEAYFTYNPDVFKGKTVLCPCDDYTLSNFVKYFVVNFDRFGLQKLICTCYSEEADNKQITLFDMLSPDFNDNKPVEKGKLFIMERQGHTVTKTKGYLNGCGDFRSAEVTALRDISDIIITNPPFSLFRDFMEWVEGKDFLILGNLNAITYKEMFPKIRDNKIWLGHSITGGDIRFSVPDDYPLNAATCEEIGGKRFIHVKAVRWFTNIPNGKDRPYLSLQSKEDNLRDNKKLTKYNDTLAITDYQIYDNYNAIDVPFTECIPSDYEGIMGVPISFLDKYNPEQFEILGMGRGKINGELTYVRFFVRNKAFEQSLDIVEKKKIQDDLTLSLFDTEDFDKSL